MDAAPPPTRAPDGGGRPAPDHPWRHKHDYEDKAMATRPSTGTERTQPSDRPDFVGDPVRPPTGATPPPEGTPEPVPPAEPTDEELEEEEEQGDPGAAPPTTEEAVRGP